MNDLPPAHPTVLVWSDALLLGHALMDRTHQDFVQVVNALLAAPDDALAARLSDVATHLHAHFGEEDRWMTDSDFPPRQCHIDEHAAVLASLVAVEQRLQAGDTAVVRRFAQELAKWFPGHADHLDSALSHWLSKQRHGGKPVVIRRGVSSSVSPTLSTSSQPTSSPP